MPIHNTKGRPRTASSLATLAGIALAAFVVGPVTAPRGPSPMPATPPTCNWSDWKPGARMTPPGHWDLILRPALAASDTVVIVAGGRNTYVVGQTAPTLTTVVDPVHDPVILRQHSDGTIDPLPLPTEQGTIGDPRPVIDSRGILHLLWGEPDTILTRRRYSEKEAPRSYRSIWTATYDGTRWSTPQRLFQAPTVDWKAPYTAGFVGGATNPEIAVPFSIIDADHYDNQRQVVWLKLVANEWVLRTVVLSSVDYTAIIEPAPGSILIAYVGLLPYLEMQARRITHDWPALYVVRSVDGGKTWLPRMRVDWPPAPDVSDGETVREPRFVQTGDSVYLIWTHYSPTGSTLRAAITLDRGISWARLPELPAGDDPLLLSAAADACGIIHTVFQTSDSVTPVRIGYATLAGNRWTAGPDIVGDQAIGDQPGLGIARTHVYVVWSSGDTILMHYPPVAPDIPGFRAREVVRTPR